jgi:hypothetical protein
MGRKLAALNGSPLMRAIVAALCAYETVAIMADSDRIPTITSVQSRRPVLGAALTGMLGVHFLVTDRDR